MSGSDWRLLARGLSVAVVAGSAVMAAVGTLLLWLDGLEGGDL